MPDKKSTNNIKQQNPAKTHLIKKYVNIKELDKNAAAREQVR